MLREGWRGREERRRKLAKRKSEWDRGEVRADEIILGMDRLYAGLHISKNIRLSLVVAAVLMLKEEAFFQEFHTAP